MSRTVFKPLTLAALGLVLGGCGLTQTVTEATSATAKAIFYTQVTTLRLDFTGRPALNTDASDSNALAIPTLVRVYQLRDGKAVQAATYERLLNDSNSVLQADLLDERAVVVMPGEGAQLTMAMDKAAQYVAVVALFRHPDQQQATWRLMLTRDQLDPERPLLIELGDNTLSSRPLTEG